MTTAAIAAAHLAENTRLRRELAEARKALADIRAMALVAEQVPSAVVLPLIPTTRRSAE